MGFFESKQQKQISAALAELNLFMEEDFWDWDKKIKLTITSRKASEFPVETIEPVLRNLWVECMVRSILFSENVERKYRELILRVPGLSTAHDEEIFNLRLASQRKEMGAILGSVVNEICSIKPEYGSTLLKHLEEPELTKIKEDAKKAVKDYLNK
jgi:hypothetical protein